MRVRDVVLQDRYALNDAGSWTFNLNLVDPITELKVWFYAKNNAAGPNEAGCIPYLINEIAVVDGSEVIASLNGPEAFALSFYNQGYMPYHHQQQQGGMSQYWCLPIQFGRTLTDQEWIFDPTKFRNPQLRIQWNLANIAAVGANGYATGTAMVSVWAKVMEEGATPRGYLMSKEVKEFTSAASGDEVTYLPVDFDIRKLMIRGYVAGGALPTVFTNIKLSQDEDKWIPVDLKTDDFIFLMWDWFKEGYINLRQQADDNELREHYFDAYSFGQAVGGEDDDIVGISGFATNQYTLHAITDAGAGSSDVRHWVRGSGVNPFSTLCYPFGEQGDREDWLAVRPMGNLRLLLTQGAANYTVQIVTQQAHPY
jgi:hypothetical protein